MSVVLWFTYGLVQFPSSRWPPESSVTSLKRMYKGGMQGTKIMLFIQCVWFDMTYCHNVWGQFSNYSVIFNVFVLTASGLVFLGYTFTNWTVDLKLRKFWARDSLSLIKRHQQLKSFRQYQPRKHSTFNMWNFIRFFSVFIKCLLQSVVFAVGFSTDVYEIAFTFIF